MVKRVIFDLILFISIFIFPWWVSVLLSLIGIFIFEKFYEFIIVCTIIYVLYSSLKYGLISSPIFFSLIIIIAYILFQLIRSNIILYNKK